MTTVLVVDDEATIRRALSVNLRARGYDVHVAATGEAALAQAAEHLPDVVILDLGLPGIDGFDVVRGVRGWTRVPIIVLSARDSEADKVAALDAGADDYMSKPFGMDELLARVRVAVRSGVPDGGVSAVRTDDFTIDFVAKRVESASGETIRLTPTEWALLGVLARDAGRLVTPARLLEEVWGPQHRAGSNHLRVHVANLRRKLEPDPSVPRYLTTEPGLGYRFVPAG